MRLGATPFGLDLPVVLYPQETRISTNSFASKSFSDLSVRMSFGNHVLGLTLTGVRKKGLSGLFRQKTCLRRRPQSRNCAQPGRGRKA